MKSLKSDPEKLYLEYQKHYKKSSPEYFLNIRKKKISNGVVEAGRFLYLAKMLFLERFDSIPKISSTAP